eukprot:scaffold12880_cov73-Isochrysis_galbana.AAC.2
MCPTLATISGQLDGVTKSELGSWYSSHGWSRGGGSWAAVVAGSGTGSPSAVRRRRMCSSARRGESGAEGGCCEAGEANAKTSASSGKGDRHSRGERACAAAQTDKTRPVSPASLSGSTPRGSGLRPPLVSVFISAAPRARRADADAPSARAAARAVAAA